MKKILALLLALAMIFALCACGQPKAEETKTEETKTEEAPAEETKEEAPAEEAKEEAPAEEAKEEAPAEEAKEEEAPAEEAKEEEAPAEEAKEEEAPALMSYADFAAAELDTAVTVESFLQAKQEYNAEYGNTSLYLQDEEGAYFVYRLACTQEEYDALTVGQKLKVTGFKSEWAGEVEITDAKVEALEADPWQAEPLNADDVWGTVDMIANQNRLVSFTDAVVEAYDEEGAAFAYQNPEEKSGDLYFKVTKGDTTYEFCVETALVSADSDLYKTVEGLQVGDKVDLEGFLYWYEGPNLHTTGMGVKVN